LNNSNDRKIVSNVQDDDNEHGGTDHINTVRNNINIIPNTNTNTNTNTNDLRQGSGIVKDTRHSKYLKLKDIAK
jgi:hypothetical protein